MVVVDALDEAAATAPESLDANVSSAITPIQVLLGVA